MKINENGVIAIIVICASATIISSGYFSSKEEKPYDHSICAKAIELKSEEPDSLKLELARVKDDLRQCEDLYRELNNQKN